MASRFWLAAYIARLIDSHFSLVYFCTLKYVLKFILARQILHLARKKHHNVRQSDYNKGYV